MDGILWPISTSINISSTITRGKVAGQAWPMSTTSKITWGRVAGLLRHMSINSITSMSNWVIGGGLKRPMSTALLSWRHFQKNDRSYDTDIVDIDLPKLWIKLYMLSTILVWWKVVRFCSSYHNATRCSSACWFYVISVDKR